MSEKETSFDNVTNYNICVVNSSDYKCIIESKILQKNLINTCTSKDPALQNEWLYPKEDDKNKSKNDKSDVNTENTNESGNKTDINNNKNNKSVPNDTDFNDQTSNEIIGTDNISKSESDLPLSEPFYSPKVDILSIKHGYYKEEKDEYKVKMLNNTYVDKDLPIDLNLFVPIEIYNVDIKN